MTRLLIIFSSILLIACCQQTPKPTCSIGPTNIDYGIAEKYGYQPYFDIDIAKKCSKETNRKILILFTSWACRSTPGLDWEILMDEEVKAIIDNYYILTVLYVDDKARLPESKQYFSKSLSEEVVTLGDKNFDIQYSYFKLGGIPYYVFVDSSLNKIAEPLGYERMKDKDRFIEHLRQGLKK